MSRDEKPAPRRTRLSGSGRVRALLSLGIVLGLGSVGTLAAWSSNATATTGVFSTGAIDLKLNGSDGPANAPYGFTDLAMVSMAPGRSVAAELKVQNKGSINVTYSAKVRAVADPTGTGTAARFAENLIIKVFPNGSLISGTAPKQTCSGTAFSTKTLSTAGPVDLILPRPLATGVDDVLCIQVEIAPTPKTMWGEGPPKLQTGAPSPALTAAQSAKVHTLFEFTATAPSQ